ncbi:MAG TPA: 5,6-dimethylbenzimidazole synthase [Telluria sp.]|jgi:5,6-dimethylbenzimidazole synthase
MKIEKAASDFTQLEIDAIYRVIAQRRDVRHFVPGVIDEAVLARILFAAHQAPSVGLMQPWRFIRVSDGELREQIYSLVARERDLTAAALGSRASEFLRLKVEGIRDCSEVIVAALMDRRDTHVFGRRTLPEMDLASVSCAIQNMWLASRAEGLGMGWVSMFDPEELGKLLDIPAGGRPVAIVCLGHVDQFYPKPMLEMEGWAERRCLDDLVYQNRWGA